MYDPLVAQGRTPEQHLGRPDFGGGRAVKNRPDETAPNYVKYAPETYADRLAGRLLLAYGDLDENIQPAGLLRLAAALIKAGKHHDQLCLPGRNHGFTVEPYFQKRLWDYFIQHLQGRAPLIHHRLAVQPGVRMLI
jgi:dipeptidyl aminopeptidase/acylaminoacyl peptidase